MTALLAVDYQGWMTNSDRMIIWFIDPRECSPMASDNLGAVFEIGYIATAFGTQ